MRFIYLSKTDEQDPIYFEPLTETIKIFEDGIELSQFDNFYLFRWYKRYNQI